MKKGRFRRKRTPFEGFVKAKKQESEVQVSLSLTFTQANKNSIKHFMYIWEPVYEYKYTLKLT